MNAELINDYIKQCELEGKTPWPQIQVLYEKYQNEFATHASKNNNEQLAQLHALQYILCEGFKALINNIPASRGADGDSYDYIDIGGEPDYLPGILVYRSSIAKFVNKFDNSITPTSRK